VITLNEARTALGHAPEPGGDRYADGTTPEEGPQRQALPAPGRETVADGVAGGRAEGDGDDESPATKALVGRVDAILARAEEITAGSRRAAS
jgi:hypothetical protein